MKVLRLKLKALKKLVNLLCFLGFLFIFLPSFFSLFKNYETARVVEEYSLFFKNKNGEDIIVEKNPSHYLLPSRPGMNISGGIKAFFLCSHNFYAPIRFVWNDENKVQKFAHYQYVIYNIEEKQEYYIFSLIEIYFMSGLNFLFLLFFLVGCYFILRAGLRPLSFTKYQRSLLTQPSLKRSFENQAIRLKKRTPPKKDKT